MRHQSLASNETETVETMLSPGANSSSGMMNNSWTATTGILSDEKEVMEEFISCYRHFTALWDSSSSDYLSKTKKEPGYMELLKILRSINGECTVHDVKRKINSLRCCYRREIKKVQSSKNNYRPRLWWFNLMDFLKPVLNLRSPPHMDDSLDETIINDDDMFAESFNTETDALGDPDPDPDPEPDEEPEMEAADQTPIMRISSTFKAEEHSHSHSRDYQAPSPQSMTSNANGLYSGHPKHRKGFGSAGERHSQPAQRMSARSGRPARRRSTTSHDEEYFHFVDGEPSPKQRRMDSSYDHAESECVLIGKRMAAHFRNMRPDQRLFAERIISEVLVYGRMNQLSLRARFVPNDGDGALL
ncbi:uncharacterized protein LOC117903116 isoform X3 [Drosophila subobscura]|uniref:uncharacterized protein LOC117903116 isoform X3 n=1 Tax=Drosophila subobscura TaxID=7241 RepID=UPI00155A7802|nr:uncharacterized protein LOC117903116 isoform X3 [Drosophila subobscura]